MSKSWIAEIIEKNQGVGNHQLVSKEAQCSWIHLGFHCHTQPSILSGDQMHVVLRKSLKYGDIILYSMMLYVFSL